MDKQYIDEQSIDEQSINVAERQQQLCDGLLWLMKENVRRVLRVPRALPDGRDGYGFRSGHIYKLLQIIFLKGDPDVRDENLKKEILAQILRGKLLVPASYGGQRYFLSTYDCWKEALGKDLEVAELPQEIHKSA